jgi:hypothetical protein
MYRCTSCLYQLDGNISKNPTTKIYEVGVRSGHLVALTDILNENLIECWTLDFCSCEKKLNYYRIPFLLLNKVVKNSYLESNISYWYYDILIESLKVKIN